MSSRKQQRAFDAQLLEARDASRSLEEWEAEKKRVLLLKCNTYNLNPRGTIKILAERLFQHFNDVGASSLMDEELQIMEGLEEEDDDQGSLEDFNVEGANGYVEPSQDVSAAAEEQLDPSISQDPSFYQDNALSEPYAWGGNDFLLDDSTPNPDNPTESDSESSKEDVLSLGEDYSSFDNLSQSESEGSDTKKKSRKRRRSDDNPPPKVRSKIVVPGSAGPKPQSGILRGSDLFNNYIQGDGFDSHSQQNGGQSMMAPDASGASHSHLNHQQLLEAENQALKAQLKSLQFKQQQASKAPKIQTKGKTFRKTVSFANNPQTMGKNLKQHPKQSTSHATPLMAKLVAPPAMVANLPVSVPSTPFSTNNPFRPPSLKQSILKKIYKQAFVEIDDLLPYNQTSNVGSRHESAIAIDSRTNLLTFDPNRIKKSKVTYGKKWMLAWTVFQQAALHYHPHLYYDLFMYGKNMISFMDRYSFQACLAYDRDFRLSIANQRSLDPNDRTVFWPKVSEELKIEHLNDNALPFCNECLSSGHYASNCPEAKKKKASDNNLPTPQPQQTPNYPQWPYPPPAPPAPPSNPPPLMAPGNPRPRGPTQTKACYRHNFEGNCAKPPCMFGHFCLRCKRPNCVARTCNNPISDSPNTPFRPPRPSPRS